MVTTWTWNPYTNKLEEMEGTPNFNNSLWWDGTGNNFVTTASATSIKPTNCSSVGKIHHFHRQKIECLDDKTINSEDLPLIEVCCRCQHEQDINKQPQYASRTFSRKPKLYHKGPSKYELQQANETMRIYNEKRDKRLQAEALKFAAKK